AMPSGPVAITMRCGGMLLSITRAAHPIAAAVTAIVTVGQWWRRKARIGMQTHGVQVERSETPVKCKEGCSYCVKCGRRTCGKLDALPRPAISAFTRVFDALWRREGGGGGGVITRGGDRGAPHPPTVV